MKKEKRPNVLVMVVHDLGDYLGCYGHNVRSPNLDRMAAQGARFDSHFCTSPMCTPSRGSIVTGLYPHTNGLMGLCNLGWNLPESNMTDAQRFERAGYRTCLIGFQHEVRAYGDLKFQENYGRRTISGSNYSTDYAAECADEWLKELAASRAGDGGEEPPF